MNDLEHAEQLLSHLAPAQVAAVVHLMEVMLDPASRALANAPLEDEEISEDEERAVAEAREWLKHNKPIPHEEVLAEPGCRRPILSACAAPRFQRRISFAGKRSGKRTIKAAARPFGHQERWPAGKNARPTRGCDAQLVAWQNS